MRGMKGQQWTDKYQQVGEENKKEIKRIYNTWVENKQAGANSI